LSLAAVLEHRLSEYSDLLHNIAWLSIWVRAREHISVVEEDHSDSFNHALMHSKGEATTYANMDVVDIFDTGWILCQVSSLSLSIPLIVWRNDDDLLAKVCESDGELVNHDTKSTNGGPSAKLWGSKHDWAKLVGVMDGGSSLRWCDHLPSSLLEQVASHGDESAGELSAADQLGVVLEHVFEVNRELIEEAVLDRPNNVGEPFDISWIVLNTITEQQGDLLSFNTFLGE
jgi:hypothetical protein